MADDKQTTTDLVNKVVESFGLLHNDLEDVKNILVKMVYSLMVQLRN